VSVSQWADIATYAMNRDETGGATIHHEDGLGTTMVSAEGVAESIRHARIIDRYLDALEAWRSQFVFCMDHGRPITEDGRWYIDTYAWQDREWEDFPEFLFIAHHEDGQICLMSAHGLPNGDLIGLDLREVAA